jgi:hypothetical protein
MYFFIVLLIGVLLIIAGFIMIGRRGRRKPSGIIALTLGLLTCVGAIYPTYIGASILEGKHRAEANYLLLQSQPKQAIIAASTALSYAKASKNPRTIALNQQLLHRAYFSVRTEKAFA